MLKGQVTNHSSDPDQLESKLERFWRLGHREIVPNESSVYDHFQQRIRHESDLKVVDKLAQDLEVKWKDNTELINLEWPSLVDFSTWLKGQEGVYDDCHPISIPTLQDESLVCWVKWSD